MSREFEQPGRRQGRRVWGPTDTVPVGQWAMRATRRPARAGGPPMGRGQGHTLTGRAPSARGRRLALCEHRYTHSAAAEAACKNATAGSSAALEVFWWFAFGLLLTFLFRFSSNMLLKESASSVVDWSWLSIFISSHF